MSITATLLYGHQNITNYTNSAAGYGIDKAIFGYGYNGSSNFSITNLVFNTGVVSADTTGVGTARHYLAAAGYSLS